jgi:hypothetical protein
MADKLIITKQSIESFDIQPVVRLSPKTYIKLTELRNKTGETEKQKRSMAYLIGKIVDFALPLIEIEEGD